MSGGERVEVVVEMVVQRDIHHTKERDRINKHTW